MGAKRKVPIRYITDKHGGRRAQYWFAMQWRPLQKHIAEMMLANGDAKLVAAPDKKKIA